MGENTFKRYEKKYYLTKEQKEGLEAIILKHMKLDSFCEKNGSYLIRNIYYDTDHEDLARISTSKPLFKEKLRVRKYGTFNDGKDDYYLEIKRKSNKVVYKRRVKMTWNEINDFVSRREIPKREGYLDKQVLKELDYFLSIYKVEPKSFISYMRVAYFDCSDPSFRLTFDNNIFSRREGFSFDDDTKETELIDDDHYLMEVKVSTAIPLWFTRGLSSLNIYPCSFSKYGTDFKMKKEGNLL